MLLREPLCVLAALLASACSLELAKQTPEEEGGDVPRALCLDGTTLRRFERACDDAGCTLREIDAACPLGCSDARCRELAPTYDPERCSGSFGEPLDIATTRELDTDDACDDVVAQLDGSELCVVARERIAIAAGAELRARGSRALALVARDELVVAGVVSVAARLGESGPGARPASDLSTGTNIADQNRGASGGGHATAGAAGGGIVEESDGVRITFHGPDAGAATTDASLRTLAGGGRGGDVFGDDNGGGGGGAIALVGCSRLALAATAIVDAGGGGGGGGDGTCRGGGGGGAGGAIVLEGAVLEIAGAKLFANGGAGGQGTQWDNLNNRCSKLGQNGENARRALLPAGARVDSRGGARDTLPVDGGLGFANVNNSGPGTIHSGSGGGGAVGRIRIHRAEDSPFTLDDVTASPKPVASLITVR